MNKPNQGSEGNQSGREIWTAWSNSHTSVTST